VYAHAASGSADTEAFSAWDESAAAPYDAVQQGFFLETAPLPGFLRLQGGNIAHDDWSPKATLGVSACEASRWVSDSAILCKHTSGCAGSQRAVLSMLLQHASISQAHSYDMPALLELLAHNKPATGSAHVTGTHFTCFTGTKVRILTKLARALQPNLVFGYNYHFTCFTGTKVRILTKLARALQPNLVFGYNYAPVAYSVKPRAGGSSVEDTRWLSDSALSARVCRASASLYNTLVVTAGGRGGSAVDAVDVDLPEIALHRLSQVRRLMDADATRQCRAAYVADALLLHSRNGSVCCASEEYENAAPAAVYSALLESELSLEGLLAALWQSLSRFTAGHSNASCAPQPLNSDANSPQTQNSGANSVNSSANSSANLSAAPAESTEEYAYAGPTLAEALLEDTLPASSSKCGNDSGATRYTFNFSSSTVRSRWDAQTAKWEANKFFAEISHTDADTNRSWTLRVGSGGDMYSFLGAFGESVPPQFHNDAPWIDEVWQMTATNTAKNTKAPLLKANYVHQAGAYSRDCANKDGSVVACSQADNKTDDFMEVPYYSPSVASHCSGVQCSFASGAHVC